MSENGANFGSDQWFYTGDQSGNVSFSDLARNADAAAPVPTVPRVTHTHDIEPVRVNTQPTPSQRDTAPAVKPGQPLSTEQRQQPQPGTVSSTAYFSPARTGVTLSEEDAPLFASFANVLAARGVDPAIGADVIRWYQNFVQQTEAAQAAADEVQRRSNAAVLMREWGESFTSRVEQCFRLIDHRTDVDTADKIFNARTPDGGLLGNDPGFMRWLWSTTSGMNSPNRQVAQGYGGDSSNVPAAGDAAELVSIRKMMANDRSEYWTGKNAEYWQQRYRDLVSRNG